MGKYYFIDEEKARLANDMNSFRKYENGSATKSYMRAVDEAHTNAQKVIGMYPKLHKQIMRLLDQYAVQLANYQNQKYEIECRCPSVMISGPGNFPAGKKEKQNIARAKHCKKYDQIKGILQKIENLPKTSAVIRSDDPEAVDKLSSKIEALNTRKESGKQANVYYKKHQTLEGFPSSIKMISELRDNVRLAGRPAPGFWLANLNANIRRLKNRQKELENMAQRTASEYPASDYPEQNVCKVTENSEMMRIQLEFDGKPSEGIRNLLKKNAFRWSPKQQVWQRQLTRNAVCSTRQMLYEIKDINGGK
jgi:hypothetical protein